MADDSGRIPLARACGRGHADIASLLPEAGADKKQLIFKPLTYYLEDMPCYILKLIHVKAALPPAPCRGRLWRRLPVEGSSFGFFGFRFRNFIYFQDSRACEQLEP